MFRTRHSYWGLSKFAGWLRKVGGVPAMLRSGTSKEWREYKKAAKAANPFVYWLADDGLDALQNFVCYPKDVAYNVTYYLRSRFVEKSHFLTTGLKAGDYHAIDERIMHGLFTTLVDFIQQEKAWMEYICHSEKYDNVLPFVNRVWPFRHFVQFKFPALGLAYLHWEASLKMDDEWFGYTWREDIDAVNAEREANPEYNKPTPQALAAQDLLELYRWWKEVRPNRVDPYDASGWTAYCATKRSNGNDIFDTFDEVDPIDTKPMHETMRKLEEQYEVEDNEMLIRLIKLRKHMWT